MDNIFTPVDTQTNQEDVENALENLVGEGKKFKDVESLAKGKIQSDAFINQLQSELSELREANQKAMTLDEVKTMILSELKPVQHQTPPNGQPPVTPPVSTGTEPDLETLVSTLLERKENERRAKSNQEKVTETLREKFGTDAQIILNQKAKELGLSLDYLAKVANDSPNAFFRLVGVENTASAPVAPAPRSTVAPSPLNTSRASFWENMKRTDPKLYFSQENTMKRYKEAMGIQK